MLSRRQAPAPGRSEIPPPFHYCYCDALSIDAIGLFWIRSGLMPSSRHTLADLVRRLHAPLTAFVRSRQRGEEASDIVQETWLRASPGLETGGVANPRAYLYRIATNVMIDHAQRARRQAEMTASGKEAEQVPSSEPSAEAAAIARSELAHLRRIVDELPPRCREVFVLRKFDQVDPAVIAERLGITRGMVEKHLRNALLHIAARMGEIDDAE